ncbi:nucleotide-diphospho-sugar transferase [Entophlyctis helioformis]|nr:nucleotide-diphospho-sugar transferase [Entophlyctis helioformis]
MAACNVLFLAAGYGTRLEHDIRTHPSPAYAHLLGLPKALLPLAARPLLTHWLAVLASCPRTPPPRVFVVTNARFGDQLAQWALAAGIPPAHVLNNRTTDAAGRRGAVRDLGDAIAHFALAAQPLLVVAGDTLFLRDFDLQAFLACADAAVDADALVTGYTVARDADTLKSGIMCLSNTDTVGAVHRVTAFMEKPSPDETDARTACPCFYYLKPAAVALVREFLDETDRNGGGLADVDAAGKFIAWLVGQARVYAYAISGRLDIGGLDTYIQAEAYMAQHPRV